MRIRVPKRVRAEKLVLGMAGALVIKMRALVLAGLPTTTTLTCLAAKSFKAKKY